MRIETKNERIPISDDELEQISGGFQWAVGVCPHCNAMYSMDISISDACPVCSKSVLSAN